MTSIQNTIVNCLPVVTTVGLLLVSVDEFIEGDGLALVVVCGLSVDVVGNAVVMFWFEQLLVAVFGGRAVLAHTEEHCKQQSKHLLPVCTVHKKNIKHHKLYQNVLLWTLFYSCFSYIHLLFQFIIAFSNYLYMFIKAVKITYSHK